MTPVIRSAPRVIAWMCAAHVASMTGFAAYSTLLPRLQDEWGLNNPQAGFISGAFFAGYMAAVPLLTSLTDRVDARRVYLVSSAVAAAALAGMALLAEGLVSASLMQLAAGAGIAGTYMPGLRALTDKVSGTGAQSGAVSFYTAVFGLGTSLSILLSGWIAGALGFRWAFGLGAIGPLAAGLMVALGLPAKRPRPLHGTHVLDFRPVLKNREVRPYIFGYAVHCWELFGSRSWLVAFIVFAQQSQIAGGAAPAAWSAVTIAAIANLFGPAASIGGNELAMRHGRERLIWMAMLASGALTCALGFAAALPWYALVGLVMLHMCLVMGDSSALTAGLVTRIDERVRGAAMAVHSMLGFGAGVLAPLVIDRFDRRTAMLALYACFAATMAACALAPSYATLLAARTAAGAFGGVVAANIFTIVADVVPEARRGRAFGAVMSAFSLASILGVPISLYLALHFTWRAPYVFLAALCTGVLLAASFVIPPVRAHLAAAGERNALAQLRVVFGEANHLRSFAFSALLVFSGILVFPFISPYLVTNVGVSEAQLPLAYLVAGIAALFTARLVGGWSDTLGS